MSMKNSSGWSGPGTRAAQSVRGTLREPQGERIGLNAPQWFGEASA